MRRIKIFGYSQKIFAGSHALDSRGGYWFRETVAPRDSACATSRTPGGPDRVECRYLLPNL